MGWNMRCPECSGHMEDLGNVKECTQCAFAMYFDMTMNIAGNDTEF